jgi:hypothetical protein
MWTAISATFLFTLSLSLPLEVTEIITRDSALNTAAWQPTVGAKFQITLSRGIGNGWFTRNVAPGSADVFDLDLFDTPKSLIQQLHAQNKRVVCYFSAGSSESWRTDYAQLQAKDMGDQLRDWPREQWLDIRSADIFKIMQARIKLAAEKGCDGIDPDNIDASGDEGRRGGGFQVPLTSKDSVAYVQKLAAEAHQYGLAMGLKNAEGLLPQVSKDVEFAVNEQCAMYSGCRSYQQFLNSGKPVFHIEYASYSITNGTGINLIPEPGQFQLQQMTTEQLQQFYCLQAPATGTRNFRTMSPDTGKKFSTVIKNMDLNNWVMYCDGTWEGEAKGAKTPKTPKSPKTPKTPKSGDQGAVPALL